MGFIQVFHCIVFIGDEPVLPRLPFERKVGSFEGNTQFLMVHATVCMDCVCRILAWWRNFSSCTGESDHTHPESHHVIVM